MRKYQRNNRPRYLNTSKRNNEKSITIKEESLYKPLLVMFVIFLFVMVILFPISIFDSMIPDIMAFLRRLVGWMSLSATATLLILPISVFDVELLRIFSSADLYSNWFVVFVVGFAVFSDTLFAFIGYRFTKTLSKLFARKAKKSDLQKSNEKLQKYGNIGMFFFASTPLPFTLAIYTAGAVRLKKRWFLIAVALGRLVKYSAFALFLRVFGINLVELGQNLLTSLFG
ncbi:MAG: VTT domain-containing protein [Acholeplasmataceae bacterium]|nr:VTT domain-containing protein [Acholeplasmataceae bacterium]